MADNQVTEPSAGIASGVPNSTKEASAPRLFQLDGLRGVAALSVVLAHITAGFRPQMYFGIEKAVTPTIQTWFAASPFFLAVNGSFAVYIFFVLSGFVISASADRSRNPLPATAVARVIRLSLPCAAALLFSGVLINCGVTSASGAARIVDHWWIKQLPVGYDSPVSWRKVFGDVFGWYYVSGLSYVNGVLWTMRRELLGSLSIYAVFAFAPRFVWRGIAGVSIFLGLYYANLEPFYYVCFVAGSFLYLGSRAIARIPSSIGAVILLAGGLLGGKPFFTPPPGTFYDGLYQWAVRMHGEMYIWPLGAVFTVLGVLVWRPAVRLLGNVFGRFLGRVSFSVYLVHFPLLCCVMTRSFEKWGHASDAAFVITTLGYVLVVYGIGYLFTILIDEPSTRLSMRVKRRPWRIPWRRREMVPL